MKQIYIAWTRYQRRPVTMSERFGFKVYFIAGPSVNNAVLKAILSYPMQMMRMAYLLYSERPDVVWIQCPPNFLLHLTWLFKLISFRRVTIVSDLHNAALSRLWFSLPLTRLILNSNSIVIVHNDHVRQTAETLGVERHKLYVLEDSLPIFANSGFDAIPKGRPSFVVPCSFRSDEPVAAVLETASCLPNFDFVITGDRARALKKGYLSNKPDNVTFTGFLNVNAYEEQLANATAILCLTTGEGIQLSAAIEAVASGKPMIISNTALLRSLFAEGLFVDNRVTSLRDACDAVAADYGRYAGATRLLRDDDARKARWDRQAAKITERLYLRSGTNGPDFV